MPGKSTLCTQCLPPSSSSSQRRSAVKPRENFTFNSLADPKVKPHTVVSYKPWSHPLFYPCWYLVGPFSLVLHIFKVLLPFEKCSIMTLFLKWIISLKELLCYKRLISSSVLYMLFWYLGPFLNVPLRHYFYNGIYFLEGIALLKRLISSSCYMSLLF